MNSLARLATAFLAVITMAGCTETKIVMPMQDVSLETIPPVASVNTLATEIQALYAGQASYRGLSNSLLYKANSIPRSLYSDNPSTILREDLGAIEVSTINDGAFFTIRMAHVTNDACIELMSKLGGEYPDSLGLKYWETEGEKHPPLMSVAQAVRACDGVKALTAVFY
jgi:hypothetical protein